MPITKVEEGSHNKRPCYFVHRDGFVDMLWKGPHCGSDPWTAEDQLRKDLCEYVMIQNQKSTSLDQALAWYKEIAQSARRYMQSKRPDGSFDHCAADAMLALLLELSNDNGRRAEEAMK